MTTTPLSPAADALVPTIAAQVGDLLGRLSDRRMYSTDAAVDTIVAQTAGWLINEVDNASPFIPNETARTEATGIVADFLHTWVQPFVGAYPEGSVREVRIQAARDIAARFDAAGILIPALPGEGMAIDLLNAVRYVTGRSVKRDGTMGGGYYSVYVSPEDIAAALYAAGWRKTDA